MATTVTTDIKLSVKAVEQGTSSMGKPNHKPTWSFSRETSTGTTGLTQTDVLYASTRIAAGSTDPIDLLGSLESELSDGGTLSFVEIQTIAIKNNATTTGYILTVGAGSNPFFSGLFGSTGDQIVIQPGGAWFIDFGNVDVVAPTASTGDILLVDPGANTIGFEIIITGRSA